MKLKELVDRVVEKLKQWVTLPQPVPVPVRVRPRP
jgi:hypothetical protein